MKNIKDRFWIKIGVEAIGHEDGTMWVPDKCRFMKRACIVTYLEGQYAIVCDAHEYVKGDHYCNTKVKL